MHISPPWQVELFKKFLLTAGLVVMRNESTFQLLSGGFIACVYLFLFQLYKPITDVKTARLQAVASLQLALTMLMGLATGWPVAAPRNT